MRVQRCYWRQGPCSWTASSKARYLLLLRTQTGNWSGSNLTLWYPLPTCWKNIKGPAYCREEAKIAIMTTTELTGNKSKKTLLVLLGEVNQDLNKALFSVATDEANFREANTEAASAAAAGKAAQHIKQGVLRAATDPFKGKASSSQNCPRTM